MTTCYSLKSSSSVGMLRWRHDVGYNAVSTCQLARAQSP
jgi:hypothetical protein